MRRPADRHGRAPPSATEQGSKVRNFSTPLVDCAALPCTSESLQQSHEAASLASSGPNCGSLTETSSERGKVREKERSGSERALQRTNCSERQKFPGRLDACRDSCAEGRAACNSAESGVGRLPCSSAVLFLVHQTWRRMHEAQGGSKILHIGLASSARPTPTTQDHWVGVGRITLALGRTRLQRRCRRRIDRSAVGFPRLHSRCSVPGRGL